LGSAYDSSANQWNGYIAEAYFIDGSGLAADSFGETNSTTNQWIPKDASGLTFGTNGFYQKYGSTELANSFADSSGSPPYVTTVTGVVTKTGTRKFGTASAYFADSGDKFNFDNVVLAGNYTVDFWVYPTLDGSGDYDQLVWSGDGSALQFAFYGNGKLYIWSSGNEGGTGTGVVTSGSWQHIALVRNSTTLKAYVDGVEKISLSSGALGTQDININLGTTSTGYIDELRVSDTARWTSAFTPETSAYSVDSNTLILLPCDGADDGTTFTDSVTKTITANGDVVNTRAVRKVGDSSIIFDGSDSLSVADLTDWDFGSNAWTMEFWFNITSGDAGIFALGPYAGNIAVSVFHGVSTLDVHISNDGTNWDIQTGSVGMSPSDATWYHLAIVFTGSAYLNFVNGVLEKTTTTSTAIYNGDHSIWVGRDASSNFLTGYTDEIRISDVARYSGTFTTFGQGGGTIASPTPFTADANTLLLIHSNFNGGFGADSSGNTNDFAVTNLVATDQMIDVPTNNFATLNPLNVPTSSAPTFSEGNLQTIDAAGWGGSSTIEQSSGKWYAEFYVKTHTSTVQHVVGIDYDATKTANANEYPGRYDAGWGYRGDNGYSEHDGSASSYGDTYDDGDIIGVALNLDDNELKFYKNNTVQNSGTALSITAAKSYAFAVGNAAGAPTTTWVANFGADSSFAGNETAQGNGGDGEDFYYTPPSGFKALNTDNLPSPEIALPGKNFNTILYDDGAGAKTGVGFQPDLVWVKSRGSAYDHKLTDSVRLVTKAIMSNDSGAETTDSTGLTAFGADGFTVGADTDYSDTTGSGMVAWNWEAGGAPTADNTEDAGATPTAGSVKIDGSNLGSALAGSVAATRLSANTTAGFSVVTYIGTDAAMTVGHGLSQAPELVITKNRGADATFWSVGSDVLTSWAYKLYLDTTAAEGGASSQYGSAPTASVINYGGSGYTSGLGNLYVSYSFHSVEGYSKVGSYEGNTNADGAFVYTGFRPAWLMLKNVDRVAEWYMSNSKMSPYNVVTGLLKADDNAAEEDFANMVDYTSNGFKIRTADNAINTTTVLYIAFAESPFKYSNAR